MDYMKKRLSNKEDTMRTSFPKKNHRMKKNGGEVIFAELLAKIFPTHKKLSRRDKKKSTLTHIIRKM